MTRLTHVCLVSGDVRRLRDFYRVALRLEPVYESAEYVEFAAGAATLAIFGQDAQERLSPGSTIPGANRSVVLEFEVADVDAEYERLEPLVAKWVKPPTTQPWGNRSIHFRDPDGNLVDFYSRVAVPA